MAMSMQKVLLLMLFLTGLILSSVGSASAQNSTETYSWKQAVKKTVTDPTTYFPTGLSYDSSIRDWKTSQPLFELGFVELNPRYTISGQPNDKPLSYEAGQKRIVYDSITVITFSSLHNFSSRLIENKLKESYPNHKKFISALTWTERIAFAIAVSYKMSAAHYRQAQLNRQILANLHQN